MSCFTALKLCRFIFWSNSMLMSVATTRPAGPSCSQSHAAMKPPPAANSGHRNPWRIPSAATRRFVMGSRYCSSRESLRLALSQELSSGYASNIDKSRLRLAAGSSRRAGFCRGSESFGSRRGRKNFASLQAQTYGAGYRSRRIVLWRERERVDR
jgi:hypothetical protein